VLRARERIPTPFSSVVITFGLVAESIKELEGALGITYLSIYSLKLKVIQNPIPKCNICIWKMSFEIQENTTVNAYLQTQMWLLHVWSKKSNACFKTHMGVLHIFPIIT
jgi:hypothetical protein